MEELQSKGQSSFEYLLVVAITLGIIVPAIYLFYFSSKDSSFLIQDSQVTKIGKTIVDSAELIFYSGKGSKTTLVLNMPDNVNKAYIIDGRELVFSMTSNFGISDIVSFSNVNLTTTSLNCNQNVCQLPSLAKSGLKTIRIEAIDESSIKIETI